MERVNKKKFHVKRGYEKKRVCWNCGSRNHINKDCTRPKLVRCSVCRKRGWSTDRCPCKNRKQRERMTASRIKKGSRKYTPVESVVLVNVYNKYVKAAAKTGFQESRIGVKVFEWIDKREKLKPIRKIIKTWGGLEHVKTIVAEVSVKKGEKWAVEFIVDHKMAENEMVLGMEALSTLGYKLTVAGKECRQREIPEKSIKKEFVRKRKAEVEESDDGEISFLDEEEARRIEEWQN